MRRAVNATRGRSESLLSCFLAAAAIAFIAASAAGCADGSPTFTKSEAGAPFKPGKPDYFVVVFEQEADLSKAASIDDWERRGAYVVDELIATAGASQSRAVSIVESQGVPARTLWIANAMVVDGGPELGDQLAKLPGVETVIEGEELDAMLVQPDFGLEPVAPPRTAGWNMKAIGAPRLWKRGIRGSGAVVGSIDTGVQFDHPALVRQYRGTRGAGGTSHAYSWWDPTGDCSAPCDPVGHGTHTTGTAVGGDGKPGGLPDIGVAPDAKWIAARGCVSASCTLDTLLSAAQFMLAPTDPAGGSPRPDFRPTVINGSWELPSESTALTRMVEALDASGIPLVLATGDSGPNCRTAGAPSSLPGAFSVGAVDEENRIAPFSSRGPGVGGSLAPTVSAPGVGVVSALPPNRYGVGSGTSMAAPHATGTAALMQSANRSFVGTEDALAVEASTAAPVPDSSCGEQGGGANSVYGHGTLGAARAVGGSG